MPTQKTLQFMFMTLFIIGVIVPYYFLISYIAHHGLDLGAIIGSIAADRMSSFAWVDVVISAVTLLLFSATSRAITRGQLPFVIASTLLVGVSAGLPLLFYFLTKNGFLDKSHR